jgi:hypothetical protein
MECKKERRKALLRCEAVRSERQRNRLAPFGGIHHFHRHLLAFSQMRNAGRP